jgi:hypothetical protein
MTITFSASSAPSSVAVPILAVLLMHTASTGITNHPMQCVKTILYREQATGTSRLPLYRKYRGTVGRLVSHFIYCFVITTFCVITTFASIYTKRIEFASDIH